MGRGGGGILGGLQLDTRRPVALGVLLCALVGRPVALNMLLITPVIAGNLSVVENRRLVANDGGGTTLLVFCG